MGDYIIGDGGTIGRRWIKNGRLRWQRRTFLVPAWLEGREVIVHSYCGAGDDVFYCEYDIGNGMNRPLKGRLVLQIRDDKVVAIDANPANGNLASRVDEPSTGTWRSLIADPHLVSYSDFRHYLGKDTSSGLEVLGSDIGDDVMTGMNLIQAWDKLSRQYPIGLIDCGNQMRDDLTAAILSRVDAVVVVSTTRYDGAAGAQDTLNWLISHGYPHLVRSAVMLISNVNRVTADKAVRNLHEDFERVCRAVHDIPYDPHLSDATAIDFNRLAPATRRAFIEAAASVADGFVKAADKDPGYRTQWPEQGEGWR